MYKRFVISDVDNLVSVNLCDTLYDTMGKVNYILSTQFEVWHYTDNFEGITLVLMLEADEAAPPSEGDGTLSLFTPIPASLLENYSQQQWLEHFQNLWYTTIDEYFRETPSVSFDLDMFKYHYQQRITLDIVEVMPQPRFIPQRLSEKVQRVVDEAKAAAVKRNKGGRIQG